MPITAAAPDTRALCPIQRYRPLAESQAAERLWNGLSSQLIIVFRMESVRRLDFPAAINQHRELCRMLGFGSGEDIEGELASRIVGPRSLLTLGEL
jgi:hypothetical protein